MNIATRWILAAAFVPAIGLKLAHAWLARDPGVDGGYYTDVAKHVRDGEGLVTNLSLFHQGFESFPHASPIYPVWPLVFGEVARFFPLEATGVALPTLCWGIALLFACLWARRLSPGPVWERLPGVDAGHVLAMLLALNGVFFFYTSRPYTEGLSFALLFAGLWWLHPRWKDLRFGPALAMGIWLGLLVLVRSQLLVVAMAAACTIAFSFAFVPGRTGRIVPAIGCALAFLATLAPQVLRLAEWTRVPPATALLRFEMARASTGLSAIDVIKDGSHGLGGHVRDLFVSLPVAFDPTHAMSYWKVFHGLQYALPLALVVAVAGAVRIARDGTALASLRRWMTADRLPLVFAFALAAGGFLSLHMIRKDFSTEWHFARRHALTSIFAFFLAWLFLARHRAPRVRALATALLVFTIAASHLHATKQVRSASGAPGQSYAGLVRALEHQRDLTTGFVVAVPGPHAQRIAWRTTGVGFHWIYDRTTAADADALARLGVQWLLLEPTVSERWPLRAALDASGSGWRRREDVEGFLVYVPEAP